MATNKLCFHTGSTTKSYNLSDSVSSSPKLCVAVGTNNVKYLRLTEGTKSGELHVCYGGKTYHASTLRDFADADSPTTLSGLAFQRAQADANSYGNKIESSKFVKYVWDRDHDPENNIYLCEAYGFSWGEYDTNTDAHGYYSVPFNVGGYGSWGGTGPFKMKRSDGSFYYTVTEPFYISNADQDWYTFTHMHGGTTYIKDILKNGEPTNIRSSSNPILFMPGDTVGVVLFFGGYDALKDSASNWTYPEDNYWHPKVRLAN